MMVSPLSFLLLLSCRLDLVFTASVSASYYNLTATPQITPRPTNGFTNGSCDAECFLSIPPAEDWYWSKLYVSTTLTAATKIIIINKKTNTTSTRVEYADLPDGFTLPPTNAAGTQAATTTFGDLSTTLAYPTPYLSWDSGYYWSGTLPTVDKSGQSVCSTATGSTITTKTQTYSTQVPVTTKNVNTTNSQGSTVVSFDTDYTRTPQSTFTTSFEDRSYVTVPYEDTFQRTVPPPDSNDAYGFLYTLVKNDTILWPKSIETDGAYLSCSTPMYPAPAVSLGTASFLTETSTSFEEDDDAGQTNGPLPSTSRPREETTSPTAAPAQTDAETKPAQASQPSPAPTIESQPANTALPTEATNNSPQTVGTTIPASGGNRPSSLPPPNSAAPVSEGTAASVTLIPGSTADESQPVQQQQPPPSTFQTVNLPTTDAYGSPTSASAVVIGGQTQAIASTIIAVTPSTQQLPPDASNSDSGSGSGAAPAPATSSIPALVIGGTQTIAAGQTATINSIPVVVVVPTVPPAASSASASAAQQANSGANSDAASAPPAATQPTPLQIIPVQPSTAATAATAASVTAAAAALTLPNGVAEVVLPGGQTAAVDSASALVVVGKGGDPTTLTLSAGANTLPPAAGAAGEAGAGAAVVTLTTDGEGRGVVVVGSGGSAVVVPTEGPVRTAVATLVGGQEVVVVDGDEGKGEGVESYVVGGVTLASGTNVLGSGTAGVARQTVVLTTDAEGRTVVVEGVGASGSGSHTVALTGKGTVTGTVAASSSSSTGLGNLILSGLGASGSASSSGAAASTASSSRPGSRSSSSETTADETGTVSVSASSATASATQSGSAAASEKARGGWFVLVEGAVLLMCMVFGALTL